MNHSPTQHPAHGDPHHSQQDSKQPSFNPAPPGPKFIPPTPPLPALATAMAAPTVMPQIHDPARPTPTPSLLFNLGITHRNCPLLAIMDPAGDRSVNPPARVLQARAGFFGLQCHGETVRS